MSILSSIRNSRYAKVTASFILYGMASQLLFPLSAYALTGGPSQPEVESFTPVSSSDMVNLFTGDFSYNIPLLDVGGYPVNLAYDANIGLDDEASWVGLGWNINPGNISRNMRGVPDDFNGKDEITVSRNFKRNTTIGMNVLADFEVFSKEAKGSTPAVPGTKLTANLGLAWNNYSGLGIQASVELNKDEKSFSGFRPKIGYGSNSGFDIDVEYEFSIKGKINKTEKPTTTMQNTVLFGVGTGINSRQGIKQIGFAAKNKKTEKWTKSGMRMGGNEVVYDDVYTKPVNGAVAVSFNNPTYIPSTTPDFCTYGFSGSIRLGKEFVGINPGNTLGANFSTSGVAERHKIKKYKAVGSLYQPLANDVADDELMMDFNRSGNDGFNKASEYLSFAHTTYDVLNVSGQGMGGVYRPHFGSFGSVYDSRSLTKFSPSLGIGIDAAPLPATAKTGYQLSFDFLWGHSGRWDNAESNRSYDILKHLPTQLNSDFEGVYLKNAGEKTEVDEAFTDNIGENHAVRPKLLKNRAFRTVVTEDIENTGISYVKTVTQLKRSKRDKRNQVISTLTNEEAKTYGLLKSKSFLTDTYRKNHHIAEISVLNPDGNKYVYGVAAYNTFQKEVSFSIGAKTIDNHMDDGSSGLIAYAAADTVPSTNDNGIDHFYNSEETPSYAHSYLLSAVLSPDYMDVREDGPTTDDMGTYCYFSYKKTYNDYKWRSPYTTSDRQATLNLGLQSTNMDDKASYVYGEKELWYLDTIRTKTHIAVFYTNGRDDGLEAAGAGGNKGSRATLKLDSIKLYTLTEWDRGIANGNPLPLKSVYFKYNYELCPNTLNNGSNGGKLTLKEVYFTYGNSSLGKLSPYKFDYTAVTGSGGSNYGYERGLYDVWGNYKKATPGIHNSEYPYIDQSDRAEIDKNAAAWTLKQITLPSGGTINIELEADDYGYVQDRRAMQMMPVAAATKAIGEDEENRLYNSNLSDGLYYNNMIVFNLESGKTIDDYIDSKMTYLYFSFYINQTSSDDNYEYINGYAEIDSYAEDGGKGYIKLKGVKLQDRSTTEVANPITVASMNFARTNLKHLVYPSMDTYADNTNFWKFAKGMLGIIPEIGSMITGHNQAQVNVNRSKVFNPAKSFIRLYNPDHKKAGGGSRVKSIKIDNNWDDMTSSGEDGRIYGQTYSYTTTMDGTIISSGVASYEPMLGAAENPFRVPDFYKLRSGGPLSAKTDHYYDVPVGESVYPGPVIGYSKVRVTSLKPSDIGASGTISWHGTGYMEHEFYTAKEFPVQFSNTDIDKDIRRDRYQLLLGIGSQFSTASQGFSVTLNDMHGKTKKTSSYSEDGRLINYTEYRYFVENEDKYPAKLKNRVTVLYKDGSVNDDALVGQETDFVTDPRHSEEHSTSVTISSKADLFLAGILPIVVPALRFKVGYNHEVTSTITSSKVIQQYGILKSVTSYDLGSKITTENTAFDPETGEVLITKTKNEYDGDIYKFTYPAHWAYEGMQGAYKNIGMTFTTTLTGSEGNVANSDVLNALYPGDELAVVTAIGYTSSTKRVWVLDKYGSDITFIDKDGAKLANGAYMFKVIRSGRRNMQATPIGELVLKSNPVNVYAEFGNSTDKILKASAVTYSDYWQTYRSNAQCFDLGEPGCADASYLTAVSCSTSCDCYLCIKGLNKSTVNYVDVITENHHKPFPIPGEKINPYVWGIKGNWRPDVAYTYFERDDSYASRELTMSSGNANTTRADLDGSIQEFIPFWAYSSGSWKTSNELNPSPARNPWISSVTTRQISPEGIEMESQDAMGIYSSAIYSYLHKMPVAVSANAELRNILNENFEDYGYYNKIFDCATKNWTESNCYGAYIAPSKTEIPEFTNMMNSPMHWYIWPWFYKGASKGFYINTAVSHSGMNSVAVWNDEVSIDIDLYTKTQQPSNPTRPIADYTGYYNEFIDKFSPLANKEYILTYWIKRKSSGDAGKGAIKLENQSGSITLSSFSANANKIEGWERVSKKFTLPSGSTKIKVVFTKETASDEVYFDDLRIYPYEASMKTFVYNKTSKRLMSTLDENNYATFFEYDAEGNLIRTKRETERGIVTISENRQNIKH